MNEIVLASRNDWTLYEKNLTCQEDLGVETREGRTYRKWSCQRAVEGVTRVAVLIQAIALTLFTLFLGLLSSGVRELWNQGVSGKETLLLLIPLSKKDSGLKEPSLHSTLGKVVPVPKSSSGSLTSDESETPSASLTESESNNSLSGSDSDTVLPFSMKHEVSSVSSSRSDSSDEIALDSDEVSLGSDEEGLFDADLNNIRDEREDRLDFGLGADSIGNLLAALDSLKEEVDFRKHPLYQELLEQRKAIYQELKNNPKNVSEKRFWEFFTNCLTVHGNDPAWRSFKTQHSQLTTKKLQSWDLTELFYKASTILKDYRIVTDIEKVQRKILSPIVLNEAGPSSASKNPGLINRSDQKIGPYEVSVMSAQGIRDAMEDEDLTTLLSVERPDGSLHVPCFAVFDGHAGKGCSKFLHDHFAEYMARELSRQSDLDDLSITNAIRMAFAKANSAFLREMSEDISGSTAVVALIINNTLWIANSGDARAVLNDGGLARQLSEDAKPNKPEFKKGIESRGGMVMMNRINCVLATARAFGDRAVPGVTAKPKIRKFDLKEVMEKPRHLILACDGLFDVIGSEEAVDLIKEYSAPKEAVLNLFNWAFERGTTDNVTAMVVKL